MSGSDQFAFRNGVLHLTAPTGGELRLLWRPVPGAQIRLAGGQWHPYRPDFRILAPETPIPPDQPNEDRELLESKYAAFRAFRSTLPEYLVKAVEPFTCHQWPLMLLLNRSVAARDLVKFNPVLAYALANNEQLRQGSLPEVAATEAARYSRLKQREIMDWLGFPDTEAMVRLFKKVPPAIVYPGLIRKLRQCAAFPQVLKLFGHLHTLNTGSLFLASHPDMAALLTPRLIREVADDPDEMMAAPTADMLFKLVSLLEKHGVLSSLYPLESRHAIEGCLEAIVRVQQEFPNRVIRQEQMQRVLDRMKQPTRKLRVRQEEERIRRIQEELDRDESQRKDELHRLRNLVFPEPPIPGTGIIVPLRSFMELESESNEQANCVGKSGYYAERVVNGEMFMYKVLAAERHTLSIVNRGGNCWQVEQLRQIGNKLGTSNAWDVVKSWLNARQVSM